MDFITTSDGSNPPEPSAKINSVKMASYMSKRELIAMMAMQGYISTSPHLMLTPEKIAEYAVKAADALLDQLSI